MSSIDGLLHVTIEPFTGAKIELTPASTQKVQFRVDIPLDSSAKTKDVGMTIILTGKILSNAAERGTAADATGQLAAWATVWSDMAAAYAKLTIEAKAAGKIVRKYEFSDVFAVDYFENYDNQQGAGQYTLVMNQRKNKLTATDVKITGGFDAE